MHVVHMHTRAGTLSVFVLGLEWKQTTLTFKSNTVITAGSLLPIFNSPKSVFRL